MNRYLKLAEFLLRSTVWKASKLTASEIETRLRSRYPDERELLNAYRLTLATTQAALRAGLCHEDGANIADPAGILEGAP